MSILEECVGLVGVGEVGRCYNHVADLLGEFGEYVGRCLTGGDIRLVGDIFPIDFRELAGDVAVEQSCLFRISLAPCFFSLAALFHDSTQFLVACVVEGFHVIPDVEWISGVGAEVFHCLFVACARCTQRIAVGRAFCLEAFTVGCHCATAHYCLADDNGRTVFFLDGSLDSAGHCKRVGTVDFDYIPVPCAILRGCIFGGHCIYLGRQLYVIAVIEHDEVAQAKISGEASGALRDFFLDTAVGDEGVCLVGQPVAETCL